MASSETQDEVNNLSKKIDAALDLCLTNCGVDADSKKESKCDFTSFQTMYDTYMSEKPAKFIKVNEVINSMIPLPKSRILTDEKLLEALIYSKVLDESEFEKNRHQLNGELVFVSANSDILYLVLVSQNQIIYSISSSKRKFTRQAAQKIWPVFKERVKNNLIDSFSTSAPTADWSQYAESLQSSFDAAAFLKATSDGHHVRYPLTDEVKEIILDEVNSLNLDSRIKKQFVFDLKVLPDKDVYYWRDRIECLRYSSNNAVVTPPEQAVAYHKASVQVVEEKAGEKLQQLMENISALQETVNRNTLCLVQLLEHRLNDDSSSAIRGELQHVSQVMTGIESSLVQMGLSQHEGNSSGEQSNGLLKALSDISNVVQFNESSLHAVDNHVKHLDGTVSSLRLLVKECKGEVQKYASLIGTLTMSMPALPEYARQSILRQSLRSPFTYYAT